MYCLPFELNSQLSILQLQLSEHFEVSYFDSSEDHRVIRRHRDSSVLQGQDTGVKITIMYFLTKDGGGELVLREWDPKEEVKEHLISENSLIILKSRQVDYEVESKKGTWFVFTSKVSGPLDSERGF